MINIQDQEELFKLIGRKLKKDISCFAFGGTAMMYYGYKNATKDIDLLFLNESDMNEFVGVIKDLGYAENSPRGVYSEEKLKKDKPKMFTRGLERFDIFLKKIFSFEASDRLMQRIHGRYDYKESNFTLTVYAVSKEDIILLKSITEREKDFDDILTIIDMEKNIDWDVIVTEAISQKKEWIKIDLEETMQKLKKHTLIDKKYFEKIYNSKLK